MSGGGSMGKSRNRSSSAPLTPQQVSGYFNEIDSHSGGQLSAYAQQGTAPVNYDQLTDAELRALGGAGASRTAAVERTRDQALERVGADPTLTTFQKVRAGQLTDQDATTSLDAISKETEALLTQLASQERGKEYQSQVRNSELAMNDLLALAEIFYGGMGTASSSKGWSMNGSGYGGVGAGGGGGGMGGG